MYTGLAKRLAATTTRQFSQPVSMEGSNAALFDFTVYELSGGGTLDVQIEGSNDLQNWTLLEDPATSTPITLSATTQGYYYTDGTAAVVATDVGFAYVRLAYEMDTGTAIINSGIDPFEQ